MQTESETSAESRGSPPGARSARLATRMNEQAVRPQDLGIGRLFGSIRDAVIVADAETGRIVLWNPAAEAIFGYSSGEALELCVEDLVPARLKERHKAGLS